MYFPRSPITLPPFVPTLISNRWNDEDDCEPLAKKSSRNNLNSNRHHHHHHHKQLVRRRMPKRYSHIIGSFGTKRKESIIYPTPQINLSRDLSKSKNEKSSFFNFHKRKSIEVKDNDDYIKLNHNDTLAHRMQVAMSSELMHSLDRNFVFGNNKQSVRNSPIVRSYSLNICTCWDETSSDPIKKQDNKDIISIEFPTPDYDEINEEFIIKTIKNDYNTSDEPVIDYDDSKLTIQLESDKQTLEQTNPEILSSSTNQPISTTKTQEEEEEEEEEISSIPPLAPPLPDFFMEEKYTGFQCRSIADEISSDHKLILKDEQDDDFDQSDIFTISAQNFFKSQYNFRPKYLALNKIPKSLSCSHLSDISLSQIGNYESNLTILCKNPSVTDDQILDRISLSSRGTSIYFDPEKRSSSSKLYNDYKKQTSITSATSNSIPSHSLINQPMNTNFGLRSSTSSGSTNERLADVTLSSKQMNVCVINQLNEHLSTRFRIQQQELFSNNNNNNITTSNANHSSSDLFKDPMSEENNIQVKNCDETIDRSEMCSNSSALLCASSVPPPPPLPVGSFSPVVPSINRSSAPCQRTSSIMMVSRESINANIPSNNMTTALSSNLSDTRILRELRENPLFARAKEQLEIEPGSSGRRSGRRLNGSTANQTSKSEINSNQTGTLISIDNYSKVNMKNSNETKASNELETIIMHQDELNAILGKRIKSNYELNRTKSHLCTRPLVQTKCRQSELELIFQKRAQRSEQNLM